MTPMTDTPISSVDYRDHYDLVVGAFRIHAASEHAFTVDVSGPSPLHDIVEANRHLGGILYLSTRLNREVPYRWLIKIQVRDHDAALIANDLIPGHTPAPEVIRDGLDAARCFTQ